MQYEFSYNIAFGRVLNWGKKISFEFISVSTLAKHLGSGFSEGNLDEKSFLTKTKPKEKDIKKNNKIIRKTKKSEMKMPSQSWWRRGRFFSRGQWIHNIFSHEGNGISLARSFFFFSRCLRQLLGGKSDTLICVSLPHGV